MSTPVAKAYTNLPDYADVEYVDGKLRVASGIVARTTDADLRRRWLQTIDILLGQRAALAAIANPDSAAAENVEPEEGPDE